MSARAPLLFAALVTCTCLAWGCGGGNINELEPEAQQEPGQPELPDPLPGDPDPNQPTPPLPEETNPDAGTPPTERPSAC